MSSHSPGRRVVLLSSSRRADLVAEARRLQPLVARHAEVTLADLDGGSLPPDFDLAVVIGGDGSILRAARRMGGHQRPVVGVNLGRLGFLADLSPTEFVAQLPNLCSGRLPVVEHLMYECKLLRQDEEIHHVVGLNEVAILAGEPFALLDVQLYVDSELVTTYSCDGLIIATPIGSTAHSLSAGGPILRKDLQAFVICPVSPHTLTNRPVVDSAERVYELLANSPHAGTAVVADGRVLDSLLPGDRVRVQRADATFKLISVPGHSDYRTLREKLGWGGRLKWND